MKRLREAIARYWRARRQRASEESYDQSSYAPRTQDRAQFWAQFRVGQRLAEKTCSEAAGVARPDS
jgi:hypothetical protein